MMRRRRRTFRMIAGTRMRSSGRCFPSGRALADYLKPGKTCRKSQRNRFQHGRCSLKMGCLSPQIDKLAILMRKLMIAHWILEIPYFYLETALQWWWKQDWDGTKEEAQASRWSGSGGTEESGWVWNDRTNRDRILEWWESHGIVGGTVTIPMAELLSEVLHFIQLRVQQRY